MREIKFRAWHKGYASKTRFDKGVPAQMLFDERPGDCLVYLSQGQPVEIMQFTGLKDVNGKEVYENDIVRGIVKDVHDIFDEKDFTLLDEVGVVKMKEGIWMLSNEKDEYAEGMLYKYDSIEIIGNINQNPELI